MSEHPNAAAVRKMNESLNAGDWQALANSLADDVVWHEIGNPEATNGKAALAARWQASGPSDWTISAQIHDVLATDDHTIALSSNAVTRGGKTLHYRTAEIYHMKDGKITERWAFSDDTDAINKFFA